MIPSHCIKDVSAGKKTGGQVFGQRKTKPGEVKGLNKATQPGRGRRSPASVVWSLQLALPTSVCTDLLPVVLFPALSEPTAHASLYPFSGGSFIAQSDAGSVVPRTFFYDAWLILSPPNFSCSAPLPRGKK